VNKQYGKVLRGTPELVSAASQWSQWQDNPRDIPKGAKCEKDIIPQQAHWRSGIWKW
jgi:hypothetical protein